ncbi:MAG: MFS transporter [Bacteroidetes bacterium RIFOXYA12_FULL_35_11]|nr:MAG: MFS transporter [Bacteroidetes bacterium GWF2_35_48]OFY73524.1 MAG: MFS transporter [Bacteroidetes bacterium RIFOXYA12_FULL_35_11]OFY96695.1 MAG: MFS transporter [Bacteroidetes bacterium RIFOXYC12_FULL_35_7]HBX51066.1 2-oxoacid:acceptor oxidoreductase subunit alpha [Bacteroidales bacterium]
MSKKNNAIEMEDVVVKFVGDSGDGMQLVGTLFSETVGIDGNDLANFPDYPAEIRAPHNTVAGVSGFQVHFGSKEINNFGDLCDVIVAMNPASLKANKKWAKKGTILIIDSDTFDQKAFERAGCTANPLEDGSLKDYIIVKAPITTKVKEILAPLGLDIKTMERTRNMFTLGMVLYIFNRTFNTTFDYLDKKFAKKPQMIEANKMVIKAGFDYASSHESIDKTITVKPASLEKGKYTTVTGNIATAWGLLAASERSGRPFFLGSYPITPATEILMELARHKSLGAKVFQAEDEIAGICSAIGASYAGAMACTTTSGPGLSLKSEAIGLAVITELPLIIVNVMRGGPSTGLPTKSEQSDLYQALFGRNGEAPLIVMAATSCTDCFYASYEIAKLSMEHMTPAILLTDGNIGQGSQLFKLPDVKKLAPIKPPIAEANDPDYKPFNRDPKTLVRKWAIPGTEGLRHRVGGLEKEDGIGNVSMDPQNHQKMVDLRAAKVEKIADFIPEQTVFGDEDADLLVISWGGTLGAVRTAVQELQKQGNKVAHTHFRYIMPLPKNTEAILKKYKKIVVAELNSGQFVNYLRMKFPRYPMLQCNKVQGLPFFVSDLLPTFTKILKEK